MSLLFNMLSMLVIAFLPRSMCLLIAWLQSSSAVILEPKRIKSVTVSIVSPSVCHEVMELDAMIFIFWMLSFKPAFSLSSFTFIKRLFSSSSLPAIRVVSSAYLRLVLYSGDWHSGEMVDSCPKSNFKDWWNEVKKGELLREEVRVCYLPLCADFLGIGRWEVTGWCYRSLVFSQKLSSATWVGALIPAAELKGCYVHSLRWSEDPDQRLLHCFLTAPPLFLHSLPSLISNCLKLPFGTWCFPGCSESKASACNAGDLGSIPGLGRSLGEGNGNPVWYSCLEKSQGRRSKPVGYSLW